MTTETTLAADETILEVTAEALVKVFDVRSGEDDPDTLGLRVEIIGSQGVDYTYDLSFETVADATDDDLIYHVGDDELPIIIPANTIENLRGATLDLPSNPMQGGLVIRNPNRPNPLEGRDIELSGSLEEKVAQLLNEQINPALAAHGGFAQLERVEDTEVFITMGGGCQGCSMSAVTLRDGITQMISDTIPEVTKVIDLTEHELGETPYYG